MNRTITCLNAKGASVTFGSDFAPFLLVSADGLYAEYNNIYISDNTMTDGATYQGTTSKKRNIVLTLKDKEGHRENRNTLYHLFLPKSKGMLIYEEEGVRRMIGYYVESIVFDSSPKVRTATVSLICPDPFFAPVQESEAAISDWRANFTFPHNFTTEEFATKLQSKLAIIENDTGVERVGLEFMVNANGNVTNPSITQVETGDTLKIGNATKPFSMVAGDILVITTETNNKRVWLTHGGATTEVNSYLDEGSYFIQLMDGTNTIGYDADSGENNMTVTIKYRLKYPGV